VAATATQQTKPTTSGKAGLPMPSQPIIWSTAAPALVLPLPIRPFLNPT
jgi:hypothetical protein